MKATIFTFFSALCLLFADSQLSNVVEQLENYVQSNRQEKTYLHLDKPYYSTGENVWFKAYLVDQAYGIPIQESSLYADFISPGSEILFSKTLKVRNGGAIGDFSIPDSLDPGNYRIRAYTNWMRNYDSSFFYHRPVKIVKTFESDSLKANTNLLDQLSITFFPEGGHLVHELPGVVAFKAVNLNGKGVDIKGKVFDSNNNFITSFSSLFKGIGRFYFNPSDLGGYTAEVDYLGKKVTFDLPSIKPSGYVLNVRNGYLQNHILVSISSRNYSLQNGFFIVHRNGEVFVTSEIDNDNDSYFFKILKADIPAGICHLTFFDNQSQPVAERLLITDLPDSEPSIKLDFDNPKYATRSEVKINLSNSNIESNVNLSLSITPNATVQFAENAENIKNYLLLSSELKGHIEEPEYYFSDTKDAYDALDNLMLSQGWSRFKWEEILSMERTNPKFKEEPSLSISGSVMDLRGKEGVEGKIALAIIKESVDFLEIETNEVGEFIYPGLEFYDSAKINVKGYRLTKNGNYKENVRVQLNGSHIPPVIPLQTREISDF